MGAIIPITAASIATAGGALLNTTTSLRSTVVSQRLHFDGGSLSGTANTVATYRTMHFFPNASGNIQLTYVNASINGTSVESGPGNAVTYAAWLDYGGNIANVNVTAGGTNYSANSTMTFSAPNNGNYGTQATGTLTIVGGVITRVNITNPGAFYSGTVTVTVNDPNSTGSGATFTVNLNAISSTPVTWLGASSVSIPSMGQATSDQTPLMVYAQSNLCVRTVVTVNAGQQWVNNAVGVWANSDVDLYALGSNLGGNTNTTGLNNAEHQAIVAPNCITGTAPISGTALIGDSIGYGYYGTKNGGIYDAGPESQALYSSVPFLAMAIPSTRASQFTQANAPNRINLLSNVGKVIHQLGINDVNNSVTAAQLINETQRLVNWYHSLGLLVAIEPLTPSTSSTDGWTTLVNQSKGSFETARLTYNTAVYANIFGADLILDTASVVTDAATQKWLPSTTVYDSGTATAGSTGTVTDTGKTWTVNQWAGKRVYLTSGTGSGQTRTIVSNTTTVLSLNIGGGSSLSPAPVAGTTYQIDDGNTIDGTHPSAVGVTLRQAVVAANISFFTTR